MEDGNTTENELEAVFKYLLLTSSSDISVFTIDTVNLLNYSLVDNSNSPYLLCILKSPLKPKQSTTSPALFGKVTILESFERGEGYFQHGVKCGNNLGTDKYIGLFPATFLLLDHHCSV